MTNHGTSRRRSIGAESAEPQPPFLHRPRSSTDGDVPNLRASKTRSSELCPPVRDRSSTDSAVPRMGRRPWIEVSTELLPDTQPRLLPVMKLQIDSPKSDTPVSLIKRRLLFVFERSCGIPRPRAPGPNQPKAQRIRTVVSVDQRLLLAVMLLALMPAVSAFSFLPLRVRPPGLGLGLGPSSLSGPGQPPTAASGHQMRSSASALLTQQRLSPWVEEERGSGLLGGGQEDVQREELERALGDRFIGERGESHDATYPAPADTVSRFQKATGYLHQHSERLGEALDFAARAHQGQLRKSGEPFVIHPIETACILAEMKLDVDTVIAGLLHDTVEDTEVTVEWICSKFGSAVGEIVAGVTDADGQSDSENQRELLVAMAQEWRVALVKMADRLHNMRTLQHMPGHKQKKKARETMEVFVPLARTLGAESFEKELQRLSTSYLSVFPGAGKMLRLLPSTGPLLDSFARLQCPSLLHQFLECDEEMARLDVSSQLRCHRAKWATHCAQYALGDPSGSQIWLSPQPPQ